MSRRTIFGPALAGVAAMLGCGGSPEPEPICVTAQVLEIDACKVSRSGAILDIGPGGLLRVQQLGEDGSLSPLATLAALTPEEAFFSCPFLGFDHDPATGRTWLVVPSDQNDPNDPSSARLLQLDAAGELEWTRILDHDGRRGDGNSILHQDGALFVAVSLDPLLPFDPDDPSTWTSSELLIQRLDLAGEPVWARLDYIDDHGTPFASGGAFEPVATGLLVHATPPLIDYGPSYPLVIDPEDGAVRWLGDGHDPLLLSSDDDDVFVAWRRDAQLDLPPAPPGRELEPARTGFERRASTGELLASDEVTWPGWGTIAAAFAVMGDQALTLVQARVPDADPRPLAARGETPRDASRRDFRRGVGAETKLYRAYDEFRRHRPRRKDQARRHVGFHHGLLGVTIHDPDGSLACKGSLEVELGQGYLRRAWRIAGRPQAVASILRIDDDDVYRPGLLVLGPP